MLLVIKGAMGAGVLNLAYINKESGVLLGPILISIAAIVCFNTMFWLTEACKKTKTNNYGDLVKKVIGNKSSIFVNFVFIV